MQQLLRRCLQCLLLGLVIADIASAQTERFQNPPNSQDPSDKPIAAQEAVARMKLPDGFQVSLFAAEPAIRQPIALTTDARGRLWVAENYTYAEAALNYDMSLHDRVIILEDTDHDGRFDRRKVFWDQGKKLTSVEVGFGGVWVLCAPNLLFIPDRDGDDVPDGEPIVLLDGWNHDAIRHNIVNGLKWGPDGWLYGRHGIQATSLVGKPGATASQRTALNCCIWRYHPTRRQFEVVTTGTTNPWGFDYDDYGQMFFINTVIGHLWHAVPGAHFRRMYGADLEPHVFGLMDQTADHYHWDTTEVWSDIRKGVTGTTARAGGGHAHCGMMIYLGGNWPEEYRNGVFTVNLHGRRINHDRLGRRPAGYVGTHEPDFLIAGDLWFRGIELIYGPDGGVFVADWSDTGECHENDGVHRSSGRIYKITYGQPPNPEFVDLQAQSNRQLVERQLAANDWYVRQARRLLQERATAGSDMTSAAAALRHMFDHNPNVTRKLRALWSLWSIGAADQDWLIGQLVHGSEHVRLWAVRLLTDGDPPGSEVSARLAEMARSEPSGLVRLYLASALQRLSVEQRWDLADALVSHGADAGDPALPLLIWYGIDAAVPADSRRALQLAAASRIPLVRRHVARRIAAEIDGDPAAVDRLVRLLETELSPTVQLDFLEGISDALRGWRHAPAPKSWDRVARALAASPSEEVRITAEQLSVVFGDGRAISSLHKIVSDDPDPLARRRALQTLIASRSGDLLPLLRNLVDDHVLSTEAIKGLAFYHDAETPQRILARYARLTSPGRAAAIDTLTSRPDYALALLDAVARNSVPAADISAFHARQMQAFDDPDVNRQLTKHWGSLRETGAGKTREIARLKSWLTTTRLEAADYDQGRALFEKTCAKCHTLFGKGGAIGPDLTGSNRNNIDYLLENIVDPSATMIAGFKMSVVQMKNGRVVTGVVLEQHTRTLTVQTQEEQVVLPRDEVEQITPQNLSLMPDGLLQPLADTQIRDLIAFMAQRSAARR